MKTKVCTKCKVEKELSEFHKQKNGKYGVKGQCKVCINQQNRERKKEYYEQNREQIIQKRKEYYQQKREEILEKQREYNQRPEVKQHKKQYKKEYAQQNREAIREYKKEYNKQNREAIRKQKKEYNKEYYQKNREKRIQYNKEYRQRPEYKQRDREYQKERYHSHPNHRITECLRARVRQALKGKSKSASTLELLGCTVEFLKEYLASQFQEGMSWDNYSFEVWHIDHIRPCSSFDLKDPEQQKQCFHYTNLQPSGIVTGKLSILLGLVS